MLMIMCYVYMYWLNYFCCLTSYLKVFSERDIGHVNGVRVIKPLDIVGFCKGHFGGSTYLYMALYDLFIVYNLVCQHVQYGLFIVRYGLHIRYNLLIVQYDILIVQYDVWSPQVWGGNLGHVNPAKVVGVPHQTLIWPLLQRGLDWIQYWHSTASHIHRNQYIFVVYNLLVNVWYFYLT